MKTKLYSRILAWSMLSIIIMSVGVSCKGKDSSKTISKQVPTPLAKQYGKEFIILPGKNIIPEKLIDDSISMIAFRLLGNPSTIENISVAEWMTIKDSTGKELTYSVSHIHDGTEGGKKHGNAIEIFTREVPGGFIIEGANKITCFIGNGL